MDKRQQQLSSWLTSDLGLTIISFETASADASFRRYFRIQISPEEQNSLPEIFIAMDSPPEHEDNELFIRCTEELSNCGVQVPKIFAKDLSQGFLAISDLGVNVYQTALNPQTANDLYTDAMHSLLKMQSKHKLESTEVYSAQKLNAEIQLFDDWYIQHYHKAQLNNAELQALKNISDLLVKNALEQPQFLVHRDFHCRNLLVTKNNNPGIIDYQDMVIGPITYDLVSLFKDCYIEWPAQQVNAWALEFHKQSHRSGLHNNLNQNQWLQWFDFMGVQRHLKVLGIFSRLFYRDNKDQYLPDMPLTYKYLIETCRQYTELTPLAKILLKYPVHQHS